jgi:hypothetical protein
MRMTEGWTVVDVSPRHMIWTYGAVVVLVSVNTLIIHTLYRA